jgi:putative membrane protein
MKHPLFMAVFLLGAGAPAAAHEGVAHTWWTLDPWVLAGFGLLLFLRPRVAWSFAAGVAALFFALLWPLDALAEESLAAHMAQHMLLIAVAAPLLVHSRPAIRVLAYLPPPLPWLWRVKPAQAFAVHGAVIWLAHAPLAIQWAADSRAFHTLQHFALLGTALVFCQAMARRNRYGEAAFWTFATMLHTGALGALLTFAPRMLYAGYALDDQHLAGHPHDGTCYLVLGLAYLGAWLRDAGRRSAAP